MVWVAGPWEVERVTRDLGGGPQEWIEVRRGGQAHYCTTTGELYEFLHRHGVDIGDLVASEPPRLFDLRDGCE